MSMDLNELSPLDRVYHWEQACGHLRDDLESYPDDENLHRDLKLAEAEHTYAVRYWRQHRNGATPALTYTEWRDAQS